MESMPSGLSQHLVGRPILAAAGFHPALFVEWLRILPEGRLQPKLAALQDAFAGGAVY